MESVVLAVDIGGTKVSVGLVTFDGSLLDSVSSSITDSKSAEDIWHRLAAIIRDMIAKADASGFDIAVCGIGSAGPIDPHHGTVSAHNMRWWKAYPVVQRVAELTGLATFIDIDCKALALAEGWKGACIGERNYMAMVVSTGVGGGIVVDGKVLNGALGNAGHIGHTIVYPEGRICGCGMQGCLEAEASGTAIQAITGKAPCEATPEVIERTGRLIGIGIVSAVNLLDIRKVAIGGSVALGFGAPFFEAAQREYDSRQKMFFGKGVQIVPVGLGATGPLVGAAAVGLVGLGIKILS